MVDCNYCKEMKLVCEFCNYESDSGEEVELDMIFHYKTGNPDDIDWLVCRDHKKKVETRPDSEKRHEISLSN